MENKTAEDNREKPDFLKLAIEMGYTFGAPKVAAGMEKIWNDYVTPLQSRIAQLEKELRYKGIAIEELSQTANQRHNHIQALEKELEDQQRWISVEKELPEENQLVITFGKEPMFLIGKIYAQNISNGYDCYSEHEESYDVTHWMPLPTPPPL